MKVPEFELKWWHIVLTAYLTIVLIMCIIVFVELKTENISRQAANELIDLKQDVVDIQQKETMNSNNITAIVQVLQQKGIIQAPTQQVAQPVSAPVEQPEPEKK